MISLTRTFRRVFGRGPEERAAIAQRQAPRRPVLETPPSESAPNDPLLANFHARSGAVSSDVLQLIDALLTSLHRFTGPEWIQEGDITLVTVSRGPA